MKHSNSSLDIELRIEDLAIKSHLIHLCSFKGSESSLIQDPSINHILSFAPRASLIDRLQLKKAV